MRIRKVHPVRNFLKLGPPLIFQYISKKQNDFFKRIIIKRTKQIYNHKAKTKQTISQQKQYTKTYYQKKYINTTQNLNKYIKTNEQHKKIGYVKV